MLEFVFLRLGSTGLVHQLVDILVVTPGRLTHHIRETPQLDLSHLRYWHIFLLAFHFIV